MQLISSAHNHPNFSQMHLLVWVLKCLTTETTSLKNLKISAWILSKLIHSISNLHMITS